MTNLKEIKTQMLNLCNEAEKTIERNRTKTSVLSFLFVHELRDDIEGAFANILHYCNLEDEDNY